VTTQDSFEQFGQSFKAAMAAVRRLRGRETHRPGELSYAQYGLLFGLAAGGALPAGELALAADVSPASATQMLDALERAGLVERARSGEDRRVVLNSLTERGRQVVEARRSLFEPRWRAALAEFSTRDLLTAAAILDRITEMFDELAERPEDDKLGAVSDEPSSKLTPAA
jgi:MarR family transcriptional regulator, organic hydroperoxide resistance regulator